MKPYLILGVLLSWLLSLLGVGGWQHSVGRTQERSAWQEKENTELAQSNAKILQLETAARTAEHAAGERQAAAATNYEKEKVHAIAQKDAVIAGLRAGTLQLRDPYANGQACGDPAGTAAAPASRGNGSTGGELSQPTAEFLVTLASEADGVVNQLAACQAIVTSDRTAPVP